MASLELGTQNVFIFDDFKIDLSKERIYKNNEEIKLEPQLFSCLALSRLLSFFHMLGHLETTPPGWIPGCIPRWTCQHPPSAPSVRMLLGWAAWLAEFIKCVTLTEW